MSSTTTEPVKKRKRLSLYRLLEMRIVQVDRRIDQMDKQLSDTRLEMHQRFAQAEKCTDDLRQEMREFRQETQQQFAQVREEMNQRFAQAEKRTDDLRQEMNQQFARVDQQFIRMDGKLSWQTNFLGVMIASMSLIIIVAISILGWVMKH